MMVGLVLLVLRATSRRRSLETTDWPVGCLCGASAGSAEWAGLGGGRISIGDSNIRRQGSPKEIHLAIGISRGRTLMDSEILAAEIYHKSETNAQICLGENYAVWPQGHA